MAMRRGRFEEIYRQETQTGKSTLGALASTAAERRRELTDLRRMFPTSGILGAMLESAFGKSYKYKGSGRSSLTEKGKVSDSFDSKTMNVIRVNTAITAKNSMVLPGMARDMNVMRQNIVKLTKHSVGAASTRADAFFLKSKERENAYEAQLAEKTPQQVKDSGTKKEQKGLFGNLMSSILSLSFKDLLIGLLKGGLISGVLVGIGKYFTDSEFKKSVNDMLNSLGSAIFGSDYWENLKNEIKDNLLKGAILIGGSYLAFKGAVALFTTALTGAVGTLTSAMGAMMRNPYVLAAMGLGVGAYAYNQYRKKQKIGQAIDEGNLMNLRDRIWKEGKYEHEGGESPEETEKLNMELMETLRLASEDESNTPYRRGVAKRFLKEIEEGKEKLPSPEDFVKKDESEKVEPIRDMSPEQKKIQAKIDELQKEQKTASESRKLELSTEITELLKQKRKLKGTGPLRVSDSETSPKKVVSANAMPESYVNSEMAELIRKRFIEAGFTSEQAEAAVINAFAESKLNPKAQSPITAREDSVGLFQMNRRGGGLGTKYTKEQLQDPNFNIGLAIQAAKESKAFREAKTQSEAIEAFVRDVERPANMEEQISKRIAMANEPLENAVYKNTEELNRLNKFNEQEKESTMTEILTALLQGMASATTGATINNVNNTSVASGPVASPYNEDMMNIFKQRVTQGF
jgi:hypothetical protein